MKMVNIMEVKEYVPSGHRRTVNKRLIDEAVGARNIVLVFGTIDTGGGAHEHVHDVEQVYYVLSGNATIETPGEKCEAGPGSAVFIPPNTPHKMSNSGTKQLQILVIYSPHPKHIPQ